MVTLRDSSIFLLSIIALNGCGTEAVESSSLDDGDASPLADELDQYDLFQETFYGSAPEQLDLLFVVDNSCSMAEEQATLAAAVPGMYRALVDYGVDLHVGVVSSDMDDPEHNGRLQAHGENYFIDETVDDPELALSELVEMGTDGHYNERGRWAAYTAIERFGDTENAGFYREEAKLAVVAVSDEDDYSGICSQDHQAFARLEFVEWMFSLKPSAEDVTFSSIVTPMTGCPTGYTSGYEYLEVTSTVGGVKWSICDSDYAQALIELGDRMGVDSSWYSLSQTPVEATIQVFVEGQEIDGDAFSYEPRKAAVRVLRSINPIRPMDEVTIRYQIASL